MAEDRRNFSRGSRPRFDDRPKEGTDKDLLQLLRNIDGSSYGAYKRVVGRWDYGFFRVHIDRIQADPYAPPSAVRIVSSPKEIGLPEETFSTKEQCIATADFLTRSFKTALKAAKRSALSITSVGQEILERSAASVTPERVELRIQVAMPARGRTVLGNQAATIFDLELPDAVAETFDFTSSGAASYRDALVKHVETYQDYCALSDALEENNWISFIADDAILARKSGISQLPMEDALPFTSPESLRAQVTLPFAGTVTGMALKPGITLIVGGGYHGKSTVLSAIQRGVYSHVPGDGRELVATLPEAIKVRAEDGRPVTKVDVSPFINHLPSESNTAKFSTQNASGSTSQAASIIEAIGTHSRVLLIDEDTSATNLMIRDERMRELVSAAEEPITPLIDRISGLAKDAGVSVVIVMGGSGAYLDVADLVLQMNSYRPEDVTARAHQIAEENPRERTDIPGFPEVLPRYPERIGKPTQRSKTRSAGVDAITLDRQAVDISDVEQIVEPGQAEAIAWCMRGILHELADGEKTLYELTELVEHLIEDKGLDQLVKFGARKHPAFLARPRAVDIAAAVNRYRALEIRS